MNQEILEQLLRVAFVAGVTALGLAVWALVRITLIEERSIKELERRIERNTTRPPTQPEE